jgi:hypothetical protein
MPDDHDKLVKTISDLTSISSVAALITALAT